MYDQSLKEIHIPQAFHVKMGNFAISPLIEVFDRVIKLTEEIHILKEDCFSCNSESLEKIYHG